MTIAQVDNLNAPLSMQTGNSGFNQAEDQPPSYETALQCEALDSSGNIENLMRNTDTSQNGRHHENITSYARTLHTFQGEFANELSFKPNEIVYLIRHIDANW